MKDTDSIKKGFRDALIATYRLISESLEEQEHGKEGKKLLLRRRNIIETRVASMKHFLGILEKESSFETEGDKESKAFFTYTSLGTAKKMLDKFLTKYNSNWGKFRGFLIVHEKDTDFRFYTTPSRESDAYNLGMSGMTYTPEKVSVRIPEENFAKLKNGANVVARKTLGDDVAVCLCFHFYNSEDAKDCGVFDLDKVSSITLSMVHPENLADVQKRLKGKNGIK